VKPNETEKIRLFFFKGVIDRSKYYFPLYLSVVGLVILNGVGVLNFSLPLQIYGLVLEGIGAVVIALGLFRGVKEIERDSATHSTGAVFGGNVWKDNSSLSAVVRKTVDGT